MSSYSRSLEELVNSETIEWIFVGGKGGVGKTTTSCSLAIQLAKKRENVLIISTDPAHNLSDAFGQQFTNEPTKINGFENLYAVESDSKVSLNSGWSLDDEEGQHFGKVLSELVSNFPGIDEAMNFAELMNFIQSLNFSCIVFDTAPTGHTLRLLSFPDILEKAFKGFSGIGSQFEGILKMLDPSGGASDKPLGKLDSLRATTKGISSMFRDASKTTFVCVCIPEFLSLFETERLILELAANDMDASYIVINQVIFPIDGLADAKALEEVSQAIDESSPIYAQHMAIIKQRDLLLDHFNARRNMQTKYLRQISDLYSDDFHVVPVPLQRAEIRGLDNLVSFGNLLLSERDFPMLEE